MTTIRVCDECKAKGILTETTRHISVTHHPELKVDVCPEHANTLPKKVNADFVRMVWKIKFGTDNLTDEQAKKILMRKG